MCVYVRARTYKTCFQKAKVECPAVEMVVFSIWKTRGGSGGYGYICIPERN